MSIDLSRYMEAQEQTYELALAEIKAGLKTGHWMWFIFPQIAGLGASSKSKYYAIKNSLEAKAYLQHEILGKRLIEISTLVLNVEGRTAYQIFDHPDYLKFRSCMTLFASLQNTYPVFEKNLAKYFNGRMCDMTAYFLQTE